jgi:hypothetical protein
MTIDRPARKPEPEDMPVLAAVDAFASVMSAEGAIDLEVLTDVVTPASVDTWKAQLAAESSEERANQRRKWALLGVIQRQPHYFAPDHAEVLMAVIHPDDIQHGFTVPAELENFPVAGVAVHALRVDGRWLVHLVHDISHYLHPENR